jgi:hypothetical protein
VAEDSVAALALPGPCKDISLYLMVVAPLVCESYLGKSVCRLAMIAAPWCPIQKIHANINFMARKSGLWGISCWLSVLVLTNECYAVSFLSFDANTMGLGGAGVVTGVGGDRPYQNPAVIDDGRTQGMMDMYLGARVIDQNNFIETFEEIEDNFESLQLKNKFKNVRKAFRVGDLDPEVLRSLGVAAHQVLAEMNKLPDRYLHIAAAGGAHALAKHKTFAVGAFVHRHQLLSGVVKNDTDDLQRIARLAETAFSLADTLESSQRLEGLYSEVDWSGIEDRVRESLGSGSVDERLRNYQQLAGMQPLVNGVEEYLGEVKRAGQVMDARRLEVLARQVNWREIQGLIQRSAESWELHEDLRDPGIPPLLDGLRDLSDKLRGLNDHVDLQALAGFIADESSAQDFDDLELADVDLRDFLRYEVPDGLSSQIIYAGADVVETGLTLSLMPEALPGLSIGANIKQQEYSTIAYVQRVDKFEWDEYKLDYTRLDYQFWNLDLGVTYSVANYWTFGMAVKNIVRKELKNRFGDTLILRPIARAGVAFGTEDVMLAVDVDLTRNESLGFDVDSRYISVGSQFRLWDHQRIRLGYRYNTVDRTGLPALGLGAVFKYGSFDMAATYSEKHSEAGVALQLGFRY